MKTKTFLDEYKGHKLFAVWEVNDQGEKQGQYPLFSMGGKKAIALMTHLEEFKDFAATTRVEQERKGR